MQTAYKGMAPASLAQGAKPGCKATATAATGTSARTGAGHMEGEGPAQQARHRHEIGSAWLSSAMHGPTRVPAELAKRRPLSDARIML